MAVEPIVTALALLATLGVTNVPPVKAVDKSPATSQVTETVAYVITGDSTIYILRGSGAWRDAERGDARALAAAIAHERIHVLHGPREGPAYDEQLRVLKALRAPARYLTAVHAARQLHLHDYPK